LPAERPRPCGCAPELQRSLLLPEGGDFTVLACGSCGSVVAFHTQRAFSPLPHVEPELTYQPLALSAELSSWLGAFPRYVPHTAPSVFLASELRAADAAELERAEAAARAEQARFGVVVRLELAGVPSPKNELAQPSLAAFQDVALVMALPETTPLAELLAGSANDRRLVAEIATEKLSARPSLYDELTALIRAGGKPAAEASRAVFRLRPSATDTRRAVASALGARSLELCEGPPFVVEAELSEHILALLSLGADAEPARDVVPALRGSQLFPLRSLLRDQVAKLEQAVGSTPS